MLYHIGMSFMEVGGSNPPDPFRASEEIEETVEIVPGNATRAALR